MKHFFPKKTKFAAWFKITSLIAQNLRVSIYLQTKQKQQNIRGLHSIRCEENELCKFGLSCLNKIDFTFNYMILLKCITRPKLKCDITI